MSLELHDFRGRLTRETRAALDAELRASGTEYQETVRNVMHEWALRKIKAASFLYATVQREGLRGEREGLQPMEDPE